MTKKQRTTKPTKKKNLKLFKLFIGILLTIIALGLYLQTSFEHPLKSQSLSGFAVEHNCSEQPKGMLSFNPQDGTDGRTINFIVDVSIENWLQVEGKCTIFEIRFPGKTTNHLYVQPYEYAITVGNPSGRVEFKDKLHYSRDDGINEDTLIFNPADLDHFGGIVEFIWEGQPESLNSYTLGFTVPLRIVNPDLELDRITKYQVDVISPDGYQLSRSVPEDPFQKSLANMEFYTFQIDTTQSSDLKVYLESTQKRRFGNIMTLFETTIFGIGLALIIDFLINKEKI